MCLLLYLYFYTLIVDKDCSTVNPAPSGAGWAGGAVSLEKAADEIEDAGEEISHGQQDEYGPEDDSQNVAYDE